MVGRLALVVSLAGVLGLAAARPLADPPAGSSQERAGAGEPAAPDGRFEIDKVHSSVWFKVKHMGVANFYGRFNDVAGKVLIDAESPSESLISVSIDVASVDTANADRDKHLKSPDFFNVAEFPRITFDSEKVTPKGAGRFEVQGKLVLHGVERSVTVPVEQTGFRDTGRMGTRVGYETRFTIKRTDFGMNFDTNALSDEVEIVLSIEAQKK